MPRAEKPDEPLLFDLPLDPAADLERRPERDRPAPPPERTERTERKRPAAPPAPSAPPPSRAEAARPGPAVTAPRGESAAEDFADEPAALPPAGDGRARLGGRLTAGAGDLLAHVAVLVVLLVGSRLLGVRAAVADWPALAVFLAAFSFLYTVVPLAFWGHTLGMAFAGLSAHNRDGEPLTFDQTARRWLGGLLTLATLGLPLLVTGSRRSISDLVSGSVTTASRG